MRTAIITGASSGIGQRFAEVLGNADGIDEIWLIARRVDRLADMQNSIKARVVPISLDLTYSKCLREYRHMLADRAPEVCVLVNAAGKGCIGDFEELELSEQLDMIDLNVSALTSVTYDTLPYMSAGGQIYQIASASAFAPLPGLSTYAATKAYVRSFSESLNTELKRRKIRVIAVCPGWVRTEFLEAASGWPDTLGKIRLFLTAKQVVRKAMRDMRLGRTVSVCGARYRAARLLAKLLPARAVAFVWRRSNPGKRKKSRKKKTYREDKTS